MTFAGLGTHLTALAMASPRTLARFSVGITIVTSIRGPCWILDLASDISRPSILSVDRVLSQLAIGPFATLSSPMLRPVLDRLSVTIAAEHPGVGAAET